MKQASTPLPFAPVAWTITAFVVAALPHLLAMPPLLGAVVVLLCGWRLLAAGKGWRPPPGWLRLLLTVGAIALLAVGFGGLWGRRAATGLLCLMLAAKMLELYRLRDLRMVASVSLFLIATQFLFDERLIYLAYLFGGVLIAIGALLRIQLLELGQAVPRSGHLRIIRDAALMLLTALPVALILFVTFPRLAEPLWGLPDEVMDAKTGLSDSMSPGSIADLYIDDSAAFRAEFDGTPPRRNGATGADRFSGISTVTPGSGPFWPHAHPPPRCLPDPTISSTPSSSNRTNAAGCLPWTILLRHPTKRTPHWISR